MPPRGGTKRYVDVYDGKIWDDFQTDPSNCDLLFLGGVGIALMLNIDWFQPFSDRQFSQGAVYLSIMNLPRSQRFLRDNIILVTTLSSSGSERNQDLNHLLEPMVDDRALAPLEKGRCCDWW